MAVQTDKQTILLTSHKGVDLHAATAVRVMRDRLVGGEDLVGLHRCECHTFWSGDHDLKVETLLEVGRYFNPNKHHYGHFEISGGEPWYVGAECSGEALPVHWPGRLVGSDLADPSSELYDRLLGGAAAANCAAVDVVAFAIGQAGPLISGVLWRLVLRGETRDPLALAEQLTVARGSNLGLLVNPHMEGWLTTRPAEVA